MKLQLGLLVFIALLAELALAQSQPAGDIPADFKPPTDARNYEKREVMIPMRDGVKLYTVIVMPKGDDERADRAHPHAVQRGERAPIASTARTCCRSCRSPTSRSSRRATSASIRTCAANTGRRATMS